MATTVARLEAVLSAQTRDFDRAMGRSETRMQKVGKTAGWAGAAIAAGLGIAAKIGFDEFRDAQKVTAQTNAVLESTGGIANVTGKQIDRMADAMLRKTGIDDEQIKVGANMLLTFTRIRNEVGAGNDIFNQATAATTNLSVALGKDMQSSALLVGKALNDPIKGMTSLTRAGIQFTEGQKETIKSMIASGDQMGAQKIILKELETQFGGSAEAAGKTLSGQLNIAKESFKNLAAEIVGAVMPAFTRMTAAALQATQWLSAHPALAKAVAVALSALAAALIAARLAQLAMNLAVLANPYVAVTVAVIALGAAMVILWQRVEEARKFIVAFGLAIAPLPVALAAVWHASETFRTIVRGAMNAVADAADAVRDIFVWFREHVPGIFKGVENAIDGPLGAMRTALRGVANAAEAIKDVFVWIINNAGRVKDSIKSAIPKIPDLTPGFTPGWPFGGGDGGDFDPVTGGGAFAGMRALHNVSPKLWDDAAIMEQLGLFFMSGYRPGAITSTGNISDHSKFPSHAIDYGSGSNAGWGDSAMRSAFMALVGRPGMKQLILSPYWWQAGGGISRISSPSVLADHWNHVHAAVFDKGYGVLQKGWNMIGNFTGAPEPMVRADRGRGGNTFNIYLGGLIDKADAGRWIKSVIASAGRDGIIIDQPQPGFG